MPAAPLITFLHAGIHTYAYKCAYAGMQARACAHTSLVPLIKVLRAESCARLKYEGRRSKPLQRGQGWDLDARGWVFPGAVQRLCKKRASAVHEDLGSVLHAVRVC
eukprot:1159039-Pelagomonas_calceolata.AAC.1